MLLALTAASRSSEICHLNTKYMIKTHDKYIFTFDKLTKSWREGKPPPSVEFCAYPQQPKLCVVETIQYYLQISKKWRNKDQKNSVTFKHN